MISQSIPVNIVEPLNTKKATIERYSEQKKRRPIPQNSI